MTFWDYMHAHWITGPMFAIVVVVLLVAMPPAIGEGIAKVIRARKGDDK